MMRVKNIGDRIMRDSILYILNWDIRCQMKILSTQLDIWILIPDRDVWAIDKIWWYHLTDVVYTYKISLGH